LLVLRRRVAVAAAGSGAAVRLGGGMCMRGASVGVGGLANVGRRGGSFGVSAGRVRAPCVWLRVGVPRDAWIPKVFFIEFFFFKKKVWVDGRRSRGRQVTA
jgi:hypothetical protein